MFGITGKALGDGTKKRQFYSSLPTPPTPLMSEEVSSELMKDCVAPCVYCDGDGDHL